MKNVLCVDPSVNTTGFAYWRNLSEETPIPNRHGVLRAHGEEKMARVFYDLIIEIGETGDSIANLIIEGQEFWSGSGSMVSAKSGALFKLSWISGFMAATAWCLMDLKEDWVRVIKPSAWKGQLPKEVVQERILEVTGQEYGNHEADAVGIGLYLLGLL